jgi:hypothetical protein
VLLSLRSLHVDGTEALVVDGCDGRVSVHLSPKVFSDLGETFVKMRPVDNPPRTAQGLLDGRDLSMADRSAILSTHVELLELDEVVTDDLVNTPSLQ